MRQAIPVLALQALRDPRGPERQVRRAQLETQAQLDLSAILGLEKLVLRVRPAAAPEQLALPAREAPAPQVRRAAAQEPPGRLEIPELVAALERPAPT